MLELATNPAAWTAFLTLTALELVLGIDNIVFISILADRLPDSERNRARLIGLFLAMFMRIALLFVLAWLIGLTATWFTIAGEDLSGRDLILITGGLFLIYKSTTEVHHLLEGVDNSGAAKVSSTFAGVITQIILIDVVFSVDSIITAIGLVDEIAIMVAAIIVSVILMMLFANPIGRFVSAHPTVKMLALVFLFTIGVVLVADGFDVHLPRGYIYSAMAFAVFVELLNLQVRRRAAEPVRLRRHYSRRK
ncbi:MAG: TerC family protein [Gammaproteobacteria bacterium]|nr:TerC family protein [Gammaproteobacteria bacterium]